MAWGAVASTVPTLSRLPPFAPPASSESREPAPGRSREGPGVPRSGSPGRRGAGEDPGRARATEARGGRVCPEPIRELRLPRCAAGMVAREAGIRAGCGGGGLWRSPPFDRVRRSAREVPCSPGRRAYPIRGRDRWKRSRSARRDAAKGCPTVGEGEGARGSRSRFGTVFRLTTGIAHGDPLADDDRTDGRLYRVSYRLPARAPSAVRTLGNLPERHQKFILLCLSDPSRRERLPAKRFTPPASRRTSRDRSS